MSATARSRPPPARRRRGFTLIELLVVIVIVGIVSSFLLLSFGLLGDDRALDQQARRLGSLLEMSLDEATLQGRDFGLELMRGGYRFVELDPILGKWDEVAGDDLLKPRQLDADMELELFIEGRRVSLNDKAAQTKKSDNENPDLTEDYAPHVLILSSGDISPFTLRIVRDTDHATKTLTVTVAGEIKIDADDKQAM
jgi:general secretion pathway protein H